MGVGACEPRRRAVSIRESPSTPSLRMYLHVIDGNFRTALSDAGA